ncbi:MAG: prolyl oligopeptidase family serine peptidase [Marinilabiliaceae bacterium]|nr:prolyl oligopeptidase family serine peptidase [Marinilabiliaceae bacterium]
MRIIIIIAAFVLSATTLMAQPTGLNIVFIGNSITYGACSENPKTDAPPIKVGELLRTHADMGNVDIRNVGVSGATTVDWLPTTNKYFKRAIDAADNFDNKDAQLLFVITLGTNDSAIEGPNGAPLSNEQYETNLITIIDTLLARYDKAYVIVNEPIWYSPNTHNSGARYLVEGQRRLYTYRNSVERVVLSHYRAHDKKRVLLGDTQGWDIFKDNATTYFVPENGRAGVFYLHPNKAGIARLARLWEAPIYNLWRYLTPTKYTLKSGATLMVYRATQEKVDKALVICPGGGYRFLASEHEGTQPAHWLSENGLTTAVLLYHMPQGNSQVPLNDAREALQFMRDHANEWGGYTKVGIMGSSAGGHLASTAATHLTTDAPDFHILLYPVITMDMANTHKGSRINLLGENPTDEQVAAFSNQLRVTPQTSRAFIFFSTNDGLVPPINAMSYAEALIKNGVSATIHAYPVGGHGWGFSDGFYYKKEWQSEMLRWLSSF